MYGITHFFNGFFMLGFASRFILALVLLICFYSKSKSDKALKTGLITLIICGVVIFAIGIMFTLTFFAFGGIASLFGSNYW